MSHSSNALASVVRAQVAAIWTKFRPTRNLSAEEIKSIQAERQEFSDRLLAQFRDKDVPIATIANNLRSVVHEIVREPFSNKEPTVELLVARVMDRARGAIEIPWCACCKALDGQPGFWSDSAFGPKSRGHAPVDESPDFLCSVCYEAFAWFWNRELHHENGRTWTLAPPTALLPKHAWRNPYTPGEHFDYTDGPLQSRLAIFVRRYVEQKLDRPILREPRT